MAFIQALIEDAVQLYDKTRIDISGTFLAPDESSFTSLEIDPDTSGTYYDITSNKYLDWQYDIAGEHTISVRVITDVTTTVKTFTINTVSPATDNLFSTDSMLIDYEDDIMKYVRKGRSTYIDKHRASQQRILGELDESGYEKSDGTNYTSSDIVDITEFSYWSCFMTLRIIFESLSNSVQDIYTKKSAKYNSLEIKAKKRSFIRLDYDSDGVIDASEKESMTTMKMVRR